MPKQKKGHYTIVFLGLDGSGKTRSILRLNNDSSNPPKAAWGFNCTTIPIPIKKSLSLCLPLLQYTKNTYLTCYDVGGHEKIRKIWPNYYADVYASVFLVDALDSSRWKESKQILHDMASHPLMTRKPIFILINRPTSLQQIQEISIQLDVEGLVRKSQKGISYSTRDSLVLVRGCLLDHTCLGLHSGIEWLIKAIEMNYIDLSSRVAQDIQDQEMKWVKEKTAKKDSKKVHPNPNLDLDLD